jgi:hypothetical protein
MKKESTVEIYHEESNFVVIRVAERQYPSVLIQGDSLAGLVSAAQTAIELFDDNREEALEELKGLYYQLNQRLEAYKKILKENDIEPPF